MNPQLTVIICTYNRAHLLPDTLPSILKQNIPKTEFNVLIVNNNSTDSTDEVLAHLCRSCSNVSVIHEIQQGLSYARNAGYKKSSTEWIIYLDDDAMVPSNFVETAQQIINNNSYDCFGGTYSPWYKYGRPKWFKDIYASTADYYKKNYNHRLTYASGGIMAIKKSILVKFDGFPIHLGMKGNAIAYGEETFLQNQMKRNGYSIGIIPEWNIKHIVNKYKLNPIWFIKNGYVSGRDAWIIYHENITFKSVLKYMIRMVTLLLKRLVNTTPMLLKKNYHFQNWLIETFRPVSMQYGRVVGALQLILNRNKIAR